MTVYPRPNSPHLHVDFWVDNVRYAFSARTGSMAEALRIQTRAKKEARRLAAPTTKARDCTFDEAAHLYWDQQGQFTRDHRSLKSKMRRAVLMVGKDTKCSTINLGKFFDYRRELRKGLPALPKPKRGRKPKNDGVYATKQVNKYLELVLTILFHAERALDTKWPSVPRSSATDENKGRLLERVQPRRRYLSEEEERRLETVSDPDFMDIWKAGLETALREDNLCGARWRQIDRSESERTITVFVKAQGRDPVPHPVPLSDRMLEILERRKGHHKELIFTLPCRQDHWHEGVLRKKGEHIPVSSAQFYRRLKKACAAAEIEDFIAHDLRRTAARRMWKEKDIHAAQVLLGHRDIQTTIDYIGLTPADLGQVLARRAG